MGHCRGSEKKPEEGICQDSEATNSLNGDQTHPGASSLTVAPGAPFTTALGREPLPELCCRCSLFSPASGPAFWMCLDPVYWGNLCLAGTFDPECSLVSDLSFCDRTCGRTCDRTSQKDLGPDSMYAEFPALDGPLCQTLTLSAVL